MEITHKSQIREFIKTYAIRHRQGQRFTLHELSMHLPSYNRIQLGWDLEDCVIAGDLVKFGESGYAGKDERTLKDKIVSLFGNETVTYSNQPRVRCQRCGQNLGPRSDFSARTGSIVSDTAQ